MLACLSQLQYAPTGPSRVSEENQQGTSVFCITIKFSIRKDIILPLEPFARFSFGWMTSKKAKTVLIKMSFQRPQQIKWCDKTKMYQFLSFSFSACYSSTVCCGALSHRKSHRTPLSLSSSLFSTPHFLCHPSLWSFLGQQGDF